MGLQLLVPLLLVSGLPERPLHLPGGRMGERGWDGTPECRRWPRGPHVPGPPIQRRPWRGGCVHTGRWTRIQSSSPRGPAARE